MIASTIDPAVPEWALSLDGLDALTAAVTQAAALHQADARLTPCRIEALSGRAVHLHYGVKDRTVWIRFVAGGEPSHLLAAEGMKIGERQPGLLTAVEMAAFFWPVPVTLEASTTT